VEGGAAAQHEFTTPEPPHPTGRRGEQPEASSRPTGFAPIGTVLTTAPDRFPEPSPAALERDSDGVSDQSSTSGRLTEKRTGKRATAASEAQRAARRGRPAAEPSATPQLDAAVETISSKLGDWHHRKSNKTQARHMMDEYGATEQAVAEALHQA